jgi:hypothetical protein
MTNDNCVLGFEMMARAPTPESNLRTDLSGHWALSGMRERAKLVGGRLEVWSKLESDTEVELSVPASVAYAASSLGGGMLSGGTEPDEP